MAALCEITAEYQSERIRFANPGDEPDIVIANIRLIDGPPPEPINGHPLPITAKGPACEFGRNLSYRYFGTWGVYTNKRTGEQSHQFAYQTVVPAKPASEQGIISYLIRHGEGLGVGPSRARTLYQKFAGDAVRICREQPEVAVVAVKGWKLAEATTLAERLRDAEHLECCSIDLIELLNRRGFPRTTASRSIQLWGNAAPLVIRRNPYMLMKFRGCGFKRCDAMYLDLGLPPGKLKRQALCAWYALASNTEGHTWHAVEYAINAIRANVAGADLREAEALRLCKRSGILDFARTEGAGSPTESIVDAGGKLWCAEGRKGDHEAFVARCLADAADERPAWPNTAEIRGPTDHQREKFATALSGVIGILGGGPGTGKTYAAAALTLALIRLAGSQDIAIAAPTGKAAVRITEALAGYGVPLRAKTIHSLLRVDPLSGSGGGWSFHFREGNPLPFKFLIIDESSMIDCSLMASLLAARAKGCHVLFVGDPHQLPPVGHGAPLRDMIAAGLPYGELVEIQRQAAGSLIVQACHAIKAGRASYTALHSLDAIDLAADGDRNLVRLETTKPEQQIASMLAAIQWAKANGFDPVWDVQILAAVNAKSQLSRKELNKILQVELNGNEGVNGSPFRIGDKVVNTRNQTFKLAKSTAAGSQDDEATDADSSPADEIYVANGDLARIETIEEKFLTAKLIIGGKLIRIPRGKAKDDGDEDEPSGDDGEKDKGPNTGCSWDLAYCLSVHKSQGSEWKMSILMLDEYPGAMRVASREFLYTAESRGKLLAVEIGKQETARKMISRIALGKRKTLLRERVLRGRCERLVREL